MGVSLQSLTRRAEHIRTRSVHVSFHSSLGSSVLGVNSSSHPRRRSIRSTVRALIIRGTFAALLLISGCYTGMLNTGGNVVTITPDRPLHPPLTMPEGKALTVTGSLGEFRRVHFHYGLDFSTGGQVGLPVHAVEDGIVRRVMFGRYGIGNALWIEHPNGLVSKYGHLDGFAESLLAHESFAPILDSIRLRKEFSHHPSKDAAPVVKRGDVIAYSGETGVGYPHLHFELLEGDGRTTINPLLYGLELPDTTPPELLEIVLEPAAPTSRINGRYETLSIPLQPGAVSESEQRRTRTFVPHPGDRRRPAAPGTANDPVVVAGAVQVKVAAYDPSESGGRSRLSLTSGDLTLDAQRIFEFRFDRLPWMPQRRHLLFYDLERTKLRGGAEYMQLFYERLNRELPFIDSTERGIVTLPARASKVLHELRINGADAAGNRSTVTLRLRRDGSEHPPVAAPEPNTFAGRTTDLTSEDGALRLTFGERALFEDRRFFIQRGRVSPALPKGLRPLSFAYGVGPAYLNFLDGFDGEIRTAVLSKKASAYIVAGRRAIPLMKPGAERIDDPNGDTKARALYRFTAHNTGYFAVIEDNAPPEFLKMRRNSFSGEFRIFLKPRDVGSGIDYESLRVTVDGIVCATDHDPDYDHVEVFFPEHIYKRGAHVLRADVMDRAGNKAATLVWRYRVR